MRTAFLLVSLALVPICAVAQDQEQTGPKQPIPFNHALHVTKLKQACETCHANPDPGEMVDMPDTPQCLQCHSSLTPKTQAEQKLIAFGKQNRPIDWVRVYQIPTFVRFDHRQHSQAGAKCQNCHGDVAQRVSLRKEADLSMGACISCHQQSHASIECGSCHEPR